MQISKIKITNQNLKFLISVLLLVLIGAVFFLFVQRRQNQLPQQILVRDEFIEKLVAETNQPFPLVVQGRKYYEQGEIERAQKLFKKATELDRNYRDAFYHLGVSEFVLGNYDRALYALVRAKTIDPLYKPTYEALIKVYQQKGEVAKAQELKARSEKL